jgi:RHS repeat-associated protein
MPHRVRWSSSQPMKLGRFRAARDEWVVKRLGPGQRCYASTYGRFNTPDPYTATPTSPTDPSAPQSWNRYAYVTGDPINLMDPGGTCGTPSTLSQTGDVISISVSIPCDGGIFPTGPGLLTPLQGPPTDPISSTSSSGPHCPPGFVNGAGGGCVLQSQSPQSPQGQCLNSFNSSTAGQIVSAFSAIQLVTNIGNVYLDWTLLPVLKGLATEALQYVSNEFGSTEFLSVTGASAGTVVSGEGAVLVALVKAAASPLALGGISLATAVDAGVQQMCSAVPGLTF